MNALVLTAWTKSDLKDPLEHKKEPLVVVYFDDILIYSKNLNEYLVHLRSVLCVLRDEKLYANLNKCTFCMQKFVFLGYVVTS
jgi:hypothetical protein